MIKITFDELCCIGTCAKLFLANKDEKWFSEEIKLVTKFREQIKKLAEESDDWTFYIITNPFKD